MSHRDTIIIRGTTDHDAPALARLAALDSAAPIRGRALVAEVNGELRAALPLAGGRLIANPFAETAHLAELLRSHATALVTGNAAPRRRALRKRRLEPVAA